MAIVLALGMTPFPAFAVAGGGLVTATLADATAYDSITVDGAQLDAASVEDRGTMLAYDSDVEDFVPKPVYRVTVPAGTQAVSVTFPAGKSMTAGHVNSFRRCCTYSSTPSRCTISE